MRLRVGLLVLVGVLGTMLPAHPSSDTRHGYEMVRREKGLVSVDEWYWHFYERAHRRRRVWIYFGMSDPCHGIDRVRVREGDKRVRVKLMQGYHEGPGACSAMIVPSVIRIRLDKPLGDRMIIDGMTGKKRPERYKG